MDSRRDRRARPLLALWLALLAAITFAPVRGNAQRAARKMSEQDIISLLNGHVSSADVAVQAQKSGIAFPVTAAAESHIRAAGGSDDLIRVLKGLAPGVGGDHTTPAPPAAAAVLMVQSSPGQCEVYVDDERVGATSQQGRLRLSHITPGSHKVRVSLNGYQDYEQDVAVSNGGTAQVSAQLQRVAVAPPQPPQPEPGPGPSPNVNSGQPGYLGVLPMEQQPAGARGVVISGANPGGPAEQAGIKTYDVILAIDGRQVATPQMLAQAMMGRHAGEVVQVTWYNGSTTVTRPVRLTAGGQQQEQQEQQEQQGGRGQRQSQNNVRRGGFVTFRVAHDHGQSGQTYCVGVMAVGNGMIVYKSDNGVHTFEIPLDTIKEARRNPLYLVGYGAFHIKTKHGTNYNFVALNGMGQYQSPDAVLTAIDNAMGR
jgi:hypothetical protein